jgi:Tol biopolymer transport system component
VEESGATRGLVMELVEGEDLSQRIARGPVPLDEALPIAKQIADALEAAHEQGIVHRDLKPANIKVRDDGTVKVLDFGLAKAMESPTGSSPALSQSPTITTPAMMTGIGMILGSAAYMSPEQARGRTVDKRTDIWAFGCVLYEMLSGRRVFDAEDVSMTLASVMMKEPDWTALAADLPANIVKVIRRCLEKDRNRRLGDIAVAQFLISEPPAIEASHTPIAADKPVSTRAKLTRFAVVATASVLALAAGGGTAWWALRPAVELPVRFTLVTPAQPLGVHGFQRDIAVTPDGQQIVYRTGTAAMAQLAVRALDQLDVRVLPAIIGVRSPFISPDGHWIGFFEGAGGELKKVPILGGSSIAICRYVGNPLEASWGSDGVIVFATGDRTTGLLSVAAGGGEPKVLTKPDVQRGEQDHVMPFILPGGRAVLFTVVMQGLQIDNSQIAVLDLKTGQKKTLIRGGSDARYVDTGHLVYAAAGTLRAVRFDLGRMEVTSDPVPVVEKVTMSGTTGTADFAIAQNGTLVYVPGGVGAGLARTVAWVKREGGEEVLKALPRAYSLPRLSPDGSRAAFDVRDQEQDIWVWDLKRETPMRLTIDPAPDQFPVWTPDSQRIIFNSSRNGTSNLYWQAADGTGAVQRLTTSPNEQLATSISPDGTRLLFMETAQKTLFDIMMLVLPRPSTVPANAPLSAKTLVQTPFGEMNAEISPNGRWVAYQSNKGGMFQVYVQPFPDVDSGNWQVSANGGTRPVWSRNGRELFYETGRSMMAVGVETTGSTFTYGSPTKLFDTSGYYFGNQGRTYDVAADGRFLMIKLAGDARPNSGAPPPSLVVVEHWTEELKQRVPGK